MTVESREGESREGDADPAAAIPISILASAGANRGDSLFIRGLEPRIFMRLFGLFTGDPPRGPPSGPPIIFGLAKPGPPTGTDPPRKRLCPDPKPELLKLRAVGAAPNCGGASRGGARCGDANRGGTICVFRRKFNIKKCSESMYAPERNAVINDLRTARLSKIEV